MSRVHDALRKAQLAGGPSPGTSPAPQPRPSFIPQETSTAATAVLTPEGARAFVLESKFYQWSLPDKDARLDVHTDVLHAIGRHVSRKAASENSDEFGGLLFGQSNAVAYRITDLEQYRCQCDGLHLVLSLWSRRLLAAPTQQFHAANRSSLLGFYRIISGGEELELSQADLNIAESYFTHPGSVILLIGSGSTARIFYRTENGLGSELLNFPAIDGTPVETEGDGLAESNLPFRVNPPVRLNTVDESKFEPNEFEPELIDDVGKLRLNPQLTTVIVALVVVIMAVWFLRPVQSDPISSRTESSIGLQIQPLTGGLMLRWNSVSPEISSAKVGLVTIQDGTNRQELSLDKEQLMAGQFFYSPISAMVRFTLQIFSENGVQRDSVAGVVPSTLSNSLPATDQSRVPAPLRSAETVPTPKLPVAPNRVTIPKPQISERPLLKVVQFMHPAKQAVIHAPPPEQTDLAEPPALSSPVKQPDTAAPEPAQIRTPPPPAAERAPTITTQPPQPATEPPAAVTTQPPIDPPGSGVYEPPKPIQQTQLVVPQNLQALITREILVEVNLTIGVDGSIISAEASPGEGSLHRSLARFAVGNARLWTFKPARQGNRNVPGEVQIHFQFSPLR